jgi:hypothetical protein
MEELMNEELASRLRRQEFQRMMAKKMGYGNNTIDPQKNRIVDPRIGNKDQEEKTDSPKGKNK